MQELSVDLNAAMQESHAITGLPMAIAEWSFNHILDPVVVNEGSTIANHKSSPIESIADGFRPHASGIFQAIADEAWTTDTDTPSIGENRYYAVGVNDEYKYWVSPLHSVASMPDDSPLGQYLITDVAVLITYPEACKVNKIKATFNLGTKPVDWRIEIYNVPGGYWMEITNPVIDDVTGRHESWWNGTDWVTTQSLEEDEFIFADKIRLTVNTVDRPASYLHLVEFSMGREIDLTPRLISYEINQNMDEQDFVAPVGIISSSSGSIVIDNSDLAISKDTDSDYSGILNGWCQFRTYVKYDFTADGGGIEIVPTGFSYTNGWQQVNEYEVTVELFDIIKILQTLKAQAALFEDKPLAIIVRTLLDCGGISNHNFDTEDFGTDTIVKYFWTDGTETIYDALKRLCQSQQAAIYANEYGTINLITRTEIANEEDTPDWTFRGNVSDGYLPDIVTLTNKYSVQANEVTIKYRKMQAKVDDSDVTETRLKSEVWDSTDTVVLRAAPLTRTLYTEVGAPTPADKDIWIPADQAPVWPFKSKVNVDGEIIDYNGKGYLVWNFSAAVPTSSEVIVKSADEKRQRDIASYKSYVEGQSNDGASSTSAGAISNAAYHNKYTGRLSVEKRDSAGLGNEEEHSKNWKHGWMGWNGWTSLLKGGPAHPNKHFEYGTTVPGLNYANLKNIDTKPGWTLTNRRWTLENSVLTCDASADGTNDGHLYALLRDLGDTEYREFGTRFRFTGGGGDEGALLLYLSNATGYDKVNPPTTDPYLTNRCYIISFMSTARVNARGRTLAQNEISVQVKDGTSIKNIVPAHTTYSGTVTLLKNKWHDIDVVYRDAFVYDRENVGFFAGRTGFEIFIDGQYLGTWLTEDAIRPTSLIGLAARNNTKIQFENFYAATTTNAARSYYKDPANYEFGIHELPAGTNVTKRINLPMDGPKDSQKMLSLLSSSSAAISYVKVFSGYKTASSTYALLSKSKSFGPFSVVADKRYNLSLDSVIQNAMAIEIKYTSTDAISLCFEKSYLTNEPYKDAPAYVYPDNSYYDIQKQGFYSGKWTSLALQPKHYIRYNIAEHSEVNGSLVQSAKIFFDDFGPYVREIRQFDVELDNSPAKAVQVYCSNPNIEVMSIETNPARGQFSLVNASYTNEIANGSEEISEGQTIDHTLILYGYILENKGDQTKVIKDEKSIRKYGKIPVEITADWIFDDVEAEKLAQWVIEHWSEPMDTIEIEAFSNTFSQIGDKVNVVYSNIDIKPEWLYIVSDISRSYDEDGLASKLILRRVR